MSNFTNTFTENLVYGSALGVHETVETLKVDISNSNQTKLHPLFISNHGGGGFIGDKAGGMHALFNSLVTGLGITVAYPNYRLADATQFTGKSVEECTLLMWEEMYRALEDNYALVRYILKHNDIYHIDKDQIWIGGVSWGAVMGIQSIHWDKLEMGKVDFDKWANTSQGTEPINVAGSIAISGAIFTEADIDVTNKPIIHVYGLKDTTLKPYGGSNHKCPYVGPATLDSDSEYYGNPIYSKVYPNAGHCLKVPGDPFTSALNLKDAKTFFTSKFKTLIH